MAFIGLVPCMAFIVFVAFIVFMALEAFMAFMAFIAFIAFSPSMVFMEFLASNHKIDHKIQKELKKFSHGKRHKKGMAPEQGLHGVGHLHGQCWWTMVDGSGCKFGTAQTCA